MDWWSHSWIDGQHQANQTNLAEYIDPHFTHMFEKAKMKIEKKPQSNKMGFFLKKLIP